MAKASDRLTKNMRTGSDKDGSSSWIDVSLDLLAKRLTWLAFGTTGVSDRAVLDRRGAGKVVVRHVSVNSGLKPACANEAVEPDSGARGGVSGLDRTVGGKENAGCLTIGGMSRMSFTVDWGVPNAKVTCREILSARLPPG